MSRTSEQIRDERARAMGTELGGLFHALWGHVVELHGELEEFRKLYGSQDSAAVLRETAGGVFWMMRRVLWEHVLLYVARLTDDPGNGPDRSNLSLRRLPSVIEEPALKQHVERLLSGAEPAWTPVRTLRNKWLAHLDLYVWTGDPRAARLDTMDLDAVERALAAMRDVLMNIEERYFGPADRHYCPTRVYGDADDLLFWLRRGLAAEEQRRERFRRGTPLPTDYDER